jgi:hypothetical protein
MIVCACSSSRLSRTFSACSDARRFCSAVSVAFLPRRRPSAARAPAARSRRHIVKCELYSASRRSSAPISPGLEQRSTSSSTDSLYAGLKCRRLATARTSGSAAALSAPGAELVVSDATIFNLFFSDIAGLPFNSNSMKVGVSRHIGTNGTRDHGVASFARPACRAQSAGMKAEQLRHDLKL